MKYFQTLFCSALIILVSCKMQTKSESEPITSETNTTQDAIILVDVPALKGVLMESKDIQLIDVRTPEEYNEGHIENATLINFMDDNFSTEIQKLNKDLPVYVYCRSGTRSGQAAELMRNLGFTAIYDLKGGFMAWQDQ